VADAHANLAYSSVATAPSPATSGTSLTVAAGDGAKFPAVPFNATVWPAGAIPLTTNAEIVRVTARATDTLTITRTQEGTSARSVVVGDQIAATITAKSLTDIETDVATRAVDTAVVHIAGTETITGAKTFTAQSLYTTVGAGVSLASRQTADSAGSNRIELTNDGSVWLGSGGTSGGTDVAIVREAGANALQLWAAGLGSPRVRIYDPPTIYNGGGAQRPMGQDALASLTATSAAIANTETNVISYTAPANFMQAGTTFRIKAGGTGTASTATAGSTWRIRIGPTTLTGVIPASLTGTSAIGTNIPFMVEALVTIRTAGSSGTALGSIVYNANAATGNLNTTIAVGQVTAAVTVNTTVQNIVQLTYISGVSTTTSTYYQGTIEMVKA